MTRVNNGFKKRTPEDQKVKDGEKKIYEETAGDTRGRFNRFLKDAQLRVQRIEEKRCVKIFFLFDKFVSIIFSNK